MINSGSTVAIASARANGGALLRGSKPGNLDYAFVKDPHGNRVELVMSPR